MVENLVEGLPTRLDKREMKVEAINIRKEDGAEANRIPEALANAQAPLPKVDRMDTML